MAAADLHVDVQSMIDADFLVSFILIVVIYLLLLVASQHGCYPPTR